MPKLKFVGLDEYIQKLEELDKKSDSYIGEALFKGAGVVADNMRKDVQAIPVDDSVGEGDKRSIKSIQKKGLLDGLGIAPQQKNGDEINVRVGIHGYNELRTKKYPNGQPNILIARSLESGTSFMPKNRVFTKSANKSKKECEETMKQAIEISIERIMK